MRGCPMKERNSKLNYLDTFFSRFTQNCKMHRATSKSVAVSTVPDDTNYTELTCHTAQTRRVLCESQSWTSPGIRVSTSSEKGTKSKGSVPQHSKIQEDLSIVRWIGGDESETQSQGKTQLTEVNLETVILKEKKFIGNKVFCFFVFF